MATINVIIKCYDGKSVKIPSNRNYGSTNDTNLKRQIYKMKRKKPKYMKRGIEKMELIKT